MHFRRSDSNTAMDYGNYGDAPGYYGRDPPHGTPPTHYTPYPYPPVVKAEPTAPHHNDILMGRGGKNNQHVGNEQFRKFARLEAKAYSTSSKKIKSNIARGLVMKVRQLHPAGRFLKRNAATSEWADVGDEYAREKASQVLRDAVALLPEKPDDDDAGAKKPFGTVEMPELSSEATMDFRPPAPKRARIITHAAAPLPAYYSSYATTSPAWHYQTPLTPIPTTAPPLKRLRSNNWFERSAFFSTTPTSSTPLTPTRANYGRSDSSRALSEILASPTLSRQGSLCASLAGDILPGENFLLTTTTTTSGSSNHHPEKQTTVESPDVSQSSDEFFTEFF